MSHDRNVETARIETERDQSNPPQQLLDISDLSVTFPSQEGPVEAVTDVSLSIEPGETVGLVGESGSGKSVTAATILGLLEESARIDGSVEFDDQQLLTKTDDELREIRGDRISMIFQETGSSLNPVLTVGDQISETIRTHRSIPNEGISRLETSVLGNLLRSKSHPTNYERSWEQTVELFERVGIPAPEQRALEYPHEYSGGMKQRAMIAMAISCRPDLLIADEPTTALDVTIEAQILDLIDEVQAEFDTAVLFITHDMGVVNEICDRVAVMYAGRVVERAPTDELFAHPKHPYTQALLDSIPSLEGGQTLDPLAGQVPDPTDKPPGCPFGPRCPSATACCDARFPPEYPVTTADEPLPVREGGDDDVPSPRRNDPTGHAVHCVLYGSGDGLAPRRSPSDEDRQNADRGRPETDGGEP
ncbi:ABC transporter ATP-binding protein [Natrialba swarupiae]|uniref:Nickel import system ATP-binding protein NikD n=1 Tax=Natrialba swarupiae TaxID=2448032 RepID=A0A5D5AIS1_9EURY|nr:ABC transporter ATP-binding protein [Natrialba swarupiae]TYT61679.1 ABC transporter ATP-binding protein [Natrialba swarupiae]